MKKRKSGNKSSRSITRGSKVKYSVFSIAPEEHPAFKMKMREAAQKGAGEFPKLFNKIKNELKDGDALGILASVSSYGLSAFISKDGIKKPKGVSPDIEQHQVELLQAILLTLSEDEASRKVLTPQSVQAVLDTLPRVAKTFFFQRIIDSQDTDDKAAQLVRSLQERIRFHTQGVRNWGYFAEVVRITLELVQPLDADLEKHHQFSATDMIEVMLTVLKEYESRQSKRWNTLAKIYRGKSVRQVVRLYYMHVPDLAGTPDEFFSALPPTITREQTMSMLMAHFDLRLADCATFTAEEIAAASGKPREKVEHIFEELSLPLGALANRKPELLFLGNPVWEAPLVKIDEAYFIPVPQMFFSHIHRIVDRIVASAKAQTKLSTRRSRFLETQLEAVFRSALPDADIRPKAKWQIGDQQYETDLLVIIDRTILIAEAKSHRLTPEGLRGAPDRVKRHITEMVFEPSVQSARLEKLIFDARGGDPSALEVTKQLEIDAQCVDQVIRISITLDDLSILSTAEPDFKNIGWVPLTHDLAPTILIADLICIAEILDSPLPFLHYLSERSHLQRSLDFLGDELDLLGLYLSTGFNLDKVRKMDMRLVLDGMSAPIDRFFMNQETGTKFPKPKTELRPLFQKIIDRLTETKPFGWTTIGMHLLSAADPEEQREVERALLKLRGIVRKNYRDPLHTSSLHIQPPEERKARVVFYVFPEQLRSRIKSAMEHFASIALDKSDLDVCVVFSRGTETWERPYEAVMLARRDAREQPTKS